MKQIKFYTKWYQIGRFGEQISLLILNSTLIQQVSNLYLICSFDILNLAHLIIQRMLNLIKYRSVSVNIDIPFILKAQFFPQQKLFTRPTSQLISPIRANTQKINYFNFSKVYRFSTIKNHQMQPELQQKSLQKFPQQTHSQKTEQQTLIQDIIQQYQQGIFDEITKDEKPNNDSEQKKSRGLKRKAKLQKLRAQLKDPQQRKERNKQRHQKQKQKLQKQFEGKTQEQIKKFLTQRKKVKQQIKQRVKKNVEQQIGLPFLVDIAFEHRMNDKQNKSLATQIQLIVKTLKTIDPSPNVHLCGLKQQGPVKNQLNKMMYEHWPIKSYDKPLEDCLKMQKFKNKKFYYLSPDAIKTVDKIEQNDIFIIGGLVDRTVIKNASLNRALQLGIQARSLPIRPFMKQRSCLNLDHIVAIMCKFIQVKDWKAAFDHGAPKRWKKGEGEKGLRQRKEESESQNEQELNEEQEKIEQKGQNNKNEIQN